MATTTNLEASLFDRSDLRLWQNGLGDPQTLALRPSATEARPRPPDLEELGIVTWEADPASMRFRSVSKNARELLGFEASEWLARPSFWMEQVDRRDRAQALRQRLRPVLAGCRVQFRYRMTAKNGTAIEVLESCSLEGLNDRATLRGYLVRTEPEPHDGFLTAQHLALRSVLSEIPGLLWVCDKRLNVKWSLGCDFAVLKVQSERPQNANLFELFSEEDPRRVHIAMHLRAMQGERVCYDVRFANQTHQVILRPFPESGSQIEGCLGLSLDVSDRKWNEEKAFRMAITDPLTGLANYRFFRTVLDREIRRSARNGKPFSVLMFDMDGLKAINDAYGHLAGSRALCRLAGALRSACRQTDVAARFGGDEFCVILQDADPEHAQSVASRTCQFLESGQEVPRITASFGVAVFPANGTTPDELIASADRDLYKHKDRKRSEARGDAMRSQATN